MNSPINLFLKRFAEFNICLAILLFLFAHCCFAQEKESLTSSLYQADELVADTSTVVWKVAVRQGLSEVLVKITGDASVLSDPQVKNGLKEADKFVDRYQYHRNKGSQQNFLLITYDAKAVKDLLRNAGLINNAPKEWLVLFIDNVGDLETYTKLIRYLHSLPVVSQLESEDFDAERQTVRLQVEVAGGLTALEESLEATHRLIPMNAHAEHKQVPTPMHPMLFHYHWQS